MKNTFEKGILPVVEGAALVEAADSGIISNAFAELGSATGTAVNFSPVETSDLGAYIDNVVDTAQGLVLPVATLAFLYAGFKKMFEGFDSRQRS